MAVTRFSAFLHRSITWKDGQIRYAANWVVDVWSVVRGGWCKSGRGVKSCMGWTSDARHMYLAYGANWNGMSVYIYVLVVL